MGPQGPTSDVGASASGFMKRLVPQHSCGPMPRRLVGLNARISIPPTLVVLRGTLGWLAQTYFSSVEFGELDAVSQRNRRNIIEACLHESENQRPIRNCPISMVTTAKLKILRDAKADRRGAANNRLKYLSAMFGWAVENSLMEANPARDVRRLKYATAGFHTWTLAEIQQFQRVHPIGSKARLAFSLLLFLGVRRGDVINLGPENVADCVLTLVPRKTSYRRLALSFKPILPELARIIGASQIGERTFLTTPSGKPFTPAGFGNWFRQKCNEAGLPNCTAHGLRKAGATMAAENGATVHQLMALFDWTTPAQATPYTMAADRKRLTEEAMKLLVKSPLAVL